MTRPRPGGLIVLDNVLRAGREIDRAAQSEADVIIRRLNDAIAAEDGVDSVMSRCATASPWPAAAVDGRRGRLPAPIFSDGRRTTL